MKKLLFALALLISFSFFGQNKYSVYAPRYSDEKKTISCEDLSELIQYDGSYLSSSTSYSSSAIYRIKWYKYENMFFALVKFKSYGKEYVYGGWEYNYNTYSDLKDNFDKSNSKGTFFDKYIRNAKVNCN